MTWRAERASASARSTGTFRPKRRCSANSSARSSGSSRRTPTSRSSSDGEPFEIFADLLRRNAEVCARDAAIQHALTGFGEHIAIHAQSELQELNATDSGVDRAGADAPGSMRADVTVDDIPMLMCGVSATMAQTGPGFDWHRHLELVIDMLRA